jgi:hypothetical protein
MRTSRFISILLTLIIESTAQCSMAQVDGEYLSKDKSSLLSFVDNKFTYKYSSNIPFNCSDTIAFGNWRKVKGYSLIELNSIPFHMGGLVESYISEDKSLNQTGEVLFFISNPIEKYWARFNPDNTRARLIYYKLKIEIEYNLKSKVIEVESFSSETKFGLPSNYTIKSFEIIIKPMDLEMWLGNQPRIFRIIKYEVKNKESNSFKVNIPELSECYMSSLNLNNDYVIVKSKNELLWRGEIFIRTSKLSPTRPRL